MGISPPCVWQCHLLGECRAAEASFCIWGGSRRATSRQPHKGFRHGMASTDIQTSMKSTTLQAIGADRTAGRSRYPASICHLSLCTVPVPSPVSFAVLQMPVPLASSRRAKSSLSASATLRVRRIPGFSTGGFGGVCCMGLAVGGSAFPAPHIDAGNHSTMRVMMPAPTVLFPSRMAKRDFSSIAIGLCSSIVSSALSPGSTISAPSLSPTVPVTSVVRK